MNSSNYRKFVPKMNIPSFDILDLPTSVTKPNHFCNELTETIEFIQSRSIKFQNHLYCVNDDILICLNWHAKNKNGFKFFLVDGRGVDDRDREKPCGE